MALLHIGFAKCETIELICHGGGIDGFSTTSESRWRCWVLRDNRGHTCMGCTSSITGWKRVYRWRQCRVNGSSGCPSWWVLGFETTGHMWMGKKCDGRGSGRSAGHGLCVSVIQCLVFREGIRQMFIFSSSWVCQACEDQLIVGICRNGRGEGFEEWGKCVDCFSDGWIFDDGVCPS